MLKVDKDAPYRSILRHRLSGMEARCYNSKNSSYGSYGGKGIEICSDWRGRMFGFYNFYHWAIENGFSPELTIDRINPYGDYEPNNCRWATDRIQSMNKKKGVIIVENDTEITAREYCFTNGLCYHKIRARLLRGWTLYASINAPNDWKKKRKDLDDMFNKEYEGVKIRLNINLKPKKMKIVNHLNSNENKIISKVKTIADIKTGKVELFSDMVRGGYSF